MTAPRCGKPMRRYEPAAGPAVLADPVCGRPDEHNGACRSERSVARQYRIASARITAARRRQRRSLRIHASLAAVIAAALEGVADHPRGDELARRRAAKGAA